MTALWLPGLPLHDSTEAWALEDLAPRPTPDTDPWADQGRKDTRWATTRDRPGEASC